VNEVQGDPNCPFCAALLKRVEGLEALVKQLQTQIAELTNRLNQNSSNSSKPPSSDPPWARPQPRRKKSGRAQGGQPGHPGHSRALLPPERVNKIVPYVPKTCECCKRPLPQEPCQGDPEPTRFQVVELPKVLAAVTEHQGQARKCAHCGYVTRAEIPEDIRARSLGPRLTATLAFLAGCCHLSKRQIHEVCETLFGVSIGLGSVCMHEQEMTQTLESEYAAVREAVRAAPIKNVDETGWKLGRVLRWLWVVATVNAAFYQIQKGRTRKAFRALLGAALHYIITDRWGAYSKWPLSWRQLCWAHLRRDFERMSELLGACTRVGRAGKRACRELFESWHEFKAGRLDRAQLRERMQPVRERLQRALERGRDSPDKKAARFCRRLLKVYPALWTFVEVAGVEPTNNLAERMGRPAVLWRKCSFGNQSQAGCHFSEVILTTVQTLRMQGKPVLDYLTAAVTAARAGQPIPALL
jgi:transposase